jgi:hypothetical protein
MASRGKFVSSAVLVPLLIGLIGFFNLARSPRFEAFQSVDVLQLIATGMCFGVALTVLVVIVRGPRPQ